MAVTRVAGKKKPVRVVKPRVGGGSGKRIVMPGEVSPCSIELPTERKRVKTSITDYTILFYARYKFGKTTFFSTFPNTLFACTEPGSEGADIFEFNDGAGGITNWEVMRRMVDRLQRSKEYDNVVIDTADEAYRLCLEWVCKRNGLEHPHDADDYGKTWNKVSSEFCTPLRQIKQTGRGLYFTSHVREGEVKSESGGKYSSIKPSLSGQAEKAILALVDFIFYGEFINVGGEQRRVVITEGNELVTAGQRKIGGRARMPAVILLPEDEAQDYQTFVDAFEGRLPPIDPNLLTPLQSASKAATGAIQKQRAKGVAAHVRG